MTINLNYPSLKKYSIYEDIWLFVAEDKFDDLYILTFKIKILFIL